MSKFIEIPVALGNNERVLHVYLNVDHIIGVYPPKAFKQVWIGLSTDGSDGEHGVFTTLSVDDVMKRIRE